MAEKLKPCPFCGEDPKIIQAEPRIRRYKGPWYCVICCECDLYLGFDEDYGGLFDTEQEAAEAWNRRASLDDT